MFPWNFIFLQNKKEEGSKKRVVCIRTVEVPVLMHSPEVWEHPWVPLTQDHVLVGEPSL
jgi:hypothetical protein